MDILILLNNKIKVIVEIEEADIKPAQICGKFLTSALASFYIHETKEDRSVPKSDQVLIIQVLDTSKTEDKSIKVGQWENIEKRIKGLVKINGIDIGKYALFFGETSDFVNGNKKTKELINYLIGFLGGSRVMEY